MSLSNNIRRIFELKDARISELEKAIDGILPFIHEQNMEGESDYELAVLELEKIRKHK